MRFKKPKIIEKESSRLVPLDVLDAASTHTEKSAQLITNTNRETPTKDSLVNAFRDKKTLEAFNFYFQDKLEEEDNEHTQRARDLRQRITSTLAERRKTWRTQRKEAAEQVSTTIVNEISKEEDKEMTHSAHIDESPAYPSSSPTTQTTITTTHIENGNIEKESPLETSDKEEEENKNQGNDQVQETINIVNSQGQHPKWMTHPEKILACDNMSMRLHEEMLQFYDYLKETPRERSIRKVVIAQIRGILGRHFPELDMFVFGSFSSKIMLPQSDIDFQCLIRNNMAIDQRGMITRIQSVLKKAHIGRDFQAILGARVPVLKFVHEPTCQCIDISISRDYSQLQTTLKSVEFVTDFRKKFPSFVILTTILKLFLKQRGLNEVFTGGISSYGLSLMVISFLQHHPGAHDATSQPTISLGNLLLDFFALYGRYFNYESAAISVLEDGLYVPKMDLMHVSNRYWFPELCRLAIMDPTDESNIVTYPSYDVLKIRKAFYSAFLQLLQPQKSSNDVLLARLFSDREPTIIFRIGALLDMPVEEAIDVDEQDEVINVDSYSVDRRVSPPPRRHYQHRHGNGHRSKRPAYFQYNDSDTHGAQQRRRYR